MEKSNTVTNQTQNTYSKALEIYNEFCKENNLDASLPYSDPKNANQENTNAYEMVKTIIRHENGDKVADGLNIKQIKYYPWFDIDPNSGFGLSYNGYGDWFTVSIVPARLCSLDSKNVKPIAEKYLPIYSILQIK
jgi:hypothetical protein